MEMQEVLRIFPGCGAWAVVVLVLWIIVDRAERKRRNRFW